MKYLLVVAHRIGKGNRPFKMWKFRSMRVLRAPKEGSEASLRPEQDRIFWWGRGECVCGFGALRADESVEFVGCAAGGLDCGGDFVILLEEINNCAYGRY